MCTYSSPDRRGQYRKGLIMVTLLDGNMCAGLDIPAVDWIIQYDPPDDPKEYIHR